MTTPCPYYTETQEGNECSHKAWTIYTGGPTAINMKCNNNQGACTLREYKQMTSRHLQNLLVQRTSNREQIRQINAEIKELSELTGITRIILAVNKTETVLINSDK